MNYWLVKQEPTSYSFEDLLRDGKTEWTGVRNYQARNFLREMRVGDEVLFYHSGGVKAVVGKAKVCRAAYPDPTASDPAWICVDIEAVGPFANPVELNAMKAEPSLANMMLIKQGRLSVTRLTDREFTTVTNLGG
ncbi:MAG: EVE domain-containing protein [Acidobacteria bacterium]|nr:EVE domain-containing protein [Acidobacteriota bacterium]